MINDLIKSINSSSLNEAENIVKKLSKYQVDTQFNLLNINDDHTESSKSVLQLVYNHNNFVFNSFKYLV